MRNWNFRKVIVAREDMPEHHRLAATLSWPHLVALGVGAIVGTGAGDRPVANAVELAQALAASPVVHECFARQVFRFDVGRTETAADACTIAQATKAYSDQKLDLRELLVSIATSPAFSTRTAMAPGGP